MARRRYYHPGENPQPRKPQPVGGGMTVKIAKVTRQMRRQAQHDPELAAAIAEIERRQGVRERVKAARKAGFNV